MKLKKNDIWVQPYKGSRYSFNSDYIFYRIPNIRYKIIAKSWSEELHKNLLNVNPHGGSFRITENGNVITKVKSDSGWIPHYVGKYDRSIKFTGVDLNPNLELKIGDIWPGFYYLHGTRYSLSYYDEIFWRDRYGKKYYIISDNTDLIDKLRIFLPRGGRFYITEYGKVWTNSDYILNWRRVEEQIQNFSSRQKNLLKQRIEATERYPVYVCDYNKSLILDLDDFSPDFSEDYEHKYEDEYY